MKAFKNLPNGYIYSQEVDLSRDFKLVLLLNLAGVALFVLFGWLFLKLSAYLRRIIPIVAMTGQPPSTPEIILEILAAFLIALTLHEAVHGLFFLLVTRDRPIFGLRGAFAYAAAPGWYIPRNHYLAVGLSPWILISSVGLAATIIAPENALLPLLFGLTINASGAVGDLYITGWLLSQPAEALINDRGDAMTVYCPEEMVKKVGLAG